jgi:DNA-directed RNA polymerase specialized sigma24 family protein
MAMEDPQQDTDWQLIQQCLQGDRCAWQVLVERKTGLLYAYLWYCLGPERFDHHLLEELAQTVWLTLVKCDYEQLRRYQHEAGSFNTYLRQVVRQEIRLHRRAKARRLHLVPLEHQDRPDPGADSGLEQAAFAEYEATLTPEEYAFLHEELMQDNGTNQPRPRSAANRRFLKHRLLRKWDQHRKKS